MAAAFTTGASWSFPDDLPGGWVKVDGEDEKMHAEEETSMEAEPPAQPNPTPTSNTPPPASEQSTPKQEGQQRQEGKHYPPRQCRICLEVVQPTFHTPEPSSLPAALQSSPRVTYESPAGEGGRLLRPCKCKGSQKYVHEDCLSLWRLQDPLRKRNYFECPTCQHRYRLQRLSYSRWISSTVAQLGLTVLILFVAMFTLGFVADPIINLYLDPVGTVANVGSGPTESFIFDDEPAGWAEHFIKGLASLGLLGFAKFLLTLSPWHWFNMRGGGGVYIGGTGGASRAGVTGRDRLSQLSWITIIIGIATFLYAVWKGVRAWSRRTLERAGERVMDVPGVNDDDDEDEPAAATAEQ